MATVDQLPVRRRLILDANAIRALSVGDPGTRAALVRATREGYAVVIPSPVVAQVHRGGQDGVAITAVIDAIGAVLPTSERVARGAGELQARTRTSDPVEAIVGAEAMLAAPAVILSHGGDPAGVGRPQVRVVIVRG